MAKFYYAANWKLNKNPQETYQFIKALKELIPGEKTEQVLLFPTAFSLCSAIEANTVSPIELGAQNIYWEDSGAFTGENSAKMLSEMGLSFCLVGHSERRHIFGETDQQINLKIKQLQKHRICPVICLGEVLEERKSGRTEEVITEQLELALKTIDYKKEFILAYEPVWAIGTGEVASPEQAEAAHLCLREKLTQLFSQEVAEKISILYGGSVKPDNCIEIGQKPNVNGFLIGGASLQLDSFCKIISSI